MSIPELHVRMYRDGDMLCAVWNDFVNVVQSDAGFGRTVGQACENLFATSGDERLQEFNLRRTKTPDMDWQDQTQVEKFLADNGPVEVYEETVGGNVRSWFLHWKHGTMSLQGGDERTARATAALFAHLWLKGIDCGLARDLACSYFDSRIGRTA